MPGRALGQRKKRRVTANPVPTPPKGPPAAFFRLTQAGEERENLLIEALSLDGKEVRFNVDHKDLLAVSGAPLSYWLPREVLGLFKRLSPLEPATAVAQQGVASVNMDRYVRCWWEISGDRVLRRKEERSNSRPWAPFAKGGTFSRFYADIFLLMFVERDFETMRREIDQKYPYLKGNAELVIHVKQNHYFRKGLTWPLAAKLFNVREMPSGCVFGHKGPAIFPSNEADSDYLLGVLNSSLALYLCKARASREEMGGRWEVGVIQKLPIPRAVADMKERIGTLARRIHDTKAAWDEGNEISTCFKEPWLSTELRTQPEQPLSVALDVVSAREAAADAGIQARYVELDSAVFDAYSLSPETRQKVLQDLGTRPPELIWPHGEGKTAEQKRMEHVWRLLSFCVKCVIEGDDDGILPMVKCSNAPVLEERVLAEIGKIIGPDRLPEFEGEVASELRKRVPGYKRADSIGDWLANVYFECHVRLYKNRPIYWHLASSQQADPAFGVLVHYHRFGSDALRKLRGTFVPAHLERLQRELGHARQENRTDDALELQQKMDEVRAFDRKLQGLEEGESPIPVPWKEEAQQPRGWAPDIDDGVKVNILPLQRTGLLRLAKVVSVKDEEDE